MGSLCEQRLCVCVCVCPQRCSHGSPLCSPCRRGARRCHPRRAQSSCRRLGRLTWSPCGVTLPPLLPHRARRGTDPRDGAELASGRARRRLPMSPRLTLDGHLPSEPPLPALSSASSVAPGSCSRRLRSGMALPSLTHAAVLPQKLRTQPIPPPPRRILLSAQHPFLSSFTDSARIS